MQPARWSTDFRAFTWFYITFAVAVGVSYLFGRFIPAVPVTYIVAETGVPVTVPFSLTPVIEVVLLGPVFGVTSIHALYMIKENIKDHAWVARYFPRWRAVYVLCMTVVMAGAAFHGLANHFHDLAKHAGVLDSHPVFFYTIYFWDELLSHYMIPGGYFGMLLVNVVLDGREANTDHHLARREMIATSIMAAGLGTGWGYALLEGQAAWLYAFMFAGCIIVIVAFHVKHRARMQRAGDAPARWESSIANNPFVILALITSAVILTFIVTWAIVFGTRPFVPFLFQPSEVCLSYL